MAGLSVSAHAPPPPRTSSAQAYPYQQPPRPQPQAYHHSQSQPSSYQQPKPPQPQPQPQPAPPARAGAPDLTAPIPTTDTLTAAHRTLPARPSPEHVLFARDVLFLVDRTVTQQNPTADGQPQEGAVSLPDPRLRRLADDAIAALLALLAAAPTAAPPLPPHMAEAFYLRGTLHASGAFPEHVPRNPRDAFKDFETGARGGFQKAWFKLGREYEAVGDVARARDCFERGMRGGVESCFYVSCIVSLSRRGDALTCV